MFTDSCFPMIRGQLTSSYDLLIYQAFWAPQGRPQAHHLVSKTKEWPTPRCLGLVKTPSPFKWFFHTLSFFFLLSFLFVFPSAGFTPSPKDSHERGKGKGKGRVKEGKGKRRGMKRNKGPCLTRTIFDTKSYCFRYRFVIVRNSCVRSFFLEIAAIIKKRV